MIRTKIILIAALFATTIVLCRLRLRRRPNPAPNASDANDPVVARMGGMSITRSQVVRPLLEGYGLNVLINIATLESAEMEADKLKLAVTSADIAAEKEQTLAKLFGDAKKEDYPQLLDQFLQQKRISQPEFDIWLQTNAYLRKIAEPTAKAAINEAMLLKAFNSEYGETVQIRHIQCANLQEIAEAKRRLAAGESFEKVAKEMSRNTRTAPLGGLMPPFSRSADYPQVFKDVAFSLSPGEVSDTVEAGGIYHLIKLEKKMEPKAVKFADVKESIRTDLTERAVQLQINNLRQQLVDRIAQTMTVDDPELARQFAAKKAQADNAVKGEKEALDAVKRDAAPGGGRNRKRAAPAGGTPAASDKARRCRAGRIDYAVVRQSSHSTLRAGISGFGVRVSGFGKKTPGTNTRYPTPDTRNPSPNREKKT